MKELEQLDRKILDLLQNRFPISATPYLEMAQELGLTEDEVISRVRILKQQGMVRRIGAVLDARMMGYQSTLCACQVELYDLEQVAATVSALPGVTHNYQRDHRYNLWFTLTAPSAQVLAQLLQDLQQRTGVKIVTMPAISLYKIDARFEMSDKNDR